MQNNAPIAILKEELTKRGKKPEEIDTVITDITKSASLLLFTNAMSAFTEEDIATVEACATEEEANAKVLELYTARTGKNPAEEMDALLHETVKNYISNF